MDYVVAATSEGEGAVLARTIFFNELKEIHVAAGSPSTRELEQMSRALAKTSNKPDIRLSHTTFHKALAGPAVPSWRTVQVFLTVLRVNSARLKFLWDAAKAEESKARKAAKAGAVAVTTKPSPYTPDQRQVVSDDTALRPSEFSSWHLDYDWRTAPPVIQLLAAAVRDNIDPRKLLFDVAPDDPSGTAPAVALVLDNDLQRAADVIAYVAGKSRNKGIELLVRTAALRPMLMTSLVPVLHDQFRFDAESLLVAAMYAGDADERSIDIATWLIRKIYNAGNREDLVVTLVHSFEDSTSGSGPAAPPVSPLVAVKNSVPAWMAAVDGATMFRATCRAIDALIGDQRHIRTGVNLLGWISKHNYRTAIDLFINVIVHSDGEIRNVRNDPTRSVLAALTRDFPKGTAMLLMRSLLERDGGLSPVDAGTLLCFLAKEDLSLAGDLSALMLLKSSESLELILGNGDDSLAIAEIITALYARHPSETARLLRGWLVKARTPQKDLGPTLRMHQRVQPFGMITVSMLYQHPEQAVECLADVVSGLGAYELQKPNLTLFEGLDQDHSQLEKRARERLREHAGQAWFELRKYV